jgi:hypothetical protein
MTLVDGAIGDTAYKFKQQCALPFYMLFIIILYNNYLVAVGVALDKEDMNNSENDDWLHGNDSYPPMQIDTYFFSR